MSSKNKNGYLEEGVSNYNLNLIQSLNDDNNSLFINMYIAEYTVLRQEIDLYRDHQKEEIYFALVAFGGELILLSSPTVINSIPEVFLLLPLVFTSLALAYADRTVRILRIASYLHNYLRVNIIDTVKSRNIFQWEVYKKYLDYINNKQNTRFYYYLYILLGFWFLKYLFDLIKFSKKRKNVRPKMKHYLKELPEIPLTLDVLRSMRFIIPNIFSIIVFLKIYSGPWKIYHYILILISTVSTIILINLFAYLEETSGIKIKPIYKTRNELVNFETSYLDKMSTGK